MSVRPSDRVGKPTSKRLILTNCYTRTQVGITSIRSDPIRYTRRCKKWQEKTTKKDWPIISIIISSSSFSFRWWLWYYYCQWWGRGGPWTDLGPLAVNTIVKLFNLNSLKLLRMIDEANLAAVISTVCWLRHSSVIKLPQLLSTGVADGFLKRRGRNIIANYINILHIYIVCRWMCTTISPYVY